MDTYLTEEAMTALLAKATSLRKGHVLNPNSDGAYQVFVDGGRRWFKTLPALKAFLEGCTFPKEYRVFRNFDKGVTVDLDSRAAAL